MRTLTVAPWILALAEICRAQPQSGPSGGFRISLSVSPFTELLFRGGAVFSDGQVTAKNPEELQRLFMKHGANEVNARIATTRMYKIGFGDHSVARGLERARMAKALGLYLWRHSLPAAAGLQRVCGFEAARPLDFPDTRADAAGAAVLRTAREILETGVKVRIWDLGNEVEFGSAGVAVRPMPGGCDDTAGGAGWYKAPDRVDPEIGKMSVLELLRMREAERIGWLQKHLWPHLARMFAAVAAEASDQSTKARGSARTSAASRLCVRRTLWRSTQPWQTVDSQQTNWGFRSIPAPRTSHRIGSKRFGRLWKRRTGR